MTKQNDEQRPLAKHAYQIGIINAKLVLIREDMNMGNHKEALMKINESIKYIEKEIVPEFYLNEQKDENNAIENPLS